MPRGSNTQTRTFNYIPSGTNNQGAFLLSATNPENGTVNYTYSNGLLASKTDAKGQAFTYQYDGYNRLWKVFLGGSLLRTYYYDSDPVGFSAFSQYGAGRLTAVTYPAIGNITLTDRYSYMGPGYAGAGLPAVKRLLVSETLYWQDRFGHPINATVPVNLDASYTYNNEGKITSMTYPATSSGPAQTYNYSYDGGYRLNGMTDASSNALVNNVSYGPSNELLTMNYRTNSFNSFTAETRIYNNLVQLTSLTAGTLSATYNYPTGSNDGKINSSVINGETVTYQYDSLNRLIAATSSAGWGEQYAFDGFGNLTTKTGSGGAPQLSVAVNPLNNQIQGVYGLNYDANGNELYGGVSYDAENRLAGAPGLQYAYDAQNKRIFSWNGAAETWGNGTNYTVFLYSPGGQRLGSYLISVINNGQTDTNLTLQSSVATSDLFFGGRRLAIQDRLGSVGSYFPYGESRPGTNPSDTWSFATYWRDSATSLDYADQRYYSNQYGRFMTPDPYRASGGTSAPQSWNRYAYVQGDPINARDPRGLMMCLVCDYPEDDPGPGDPGPPPTPLGPDPNPQGPPIPQDPRPGGGGGQSSPPKVKYEDQASAALTYELQHLTPNCKKILPSQKTLVADSGDLAFWDVRVNGAVPVAFLPGVVSTSPTETLASSLGSANAQTLLGPNGSISNQVLLGSGFFNQVAAIQGTILLHELLHYALQLDDQQIVTTYGIAVGIGDSYSSAFENWLEHDCQNTSH